jgi:hypothetical protein
LAEFAGAAENKTKTYSIKEEKALHAVFTDALFFFFLASCSVRYQAMAPTTSNIGVACSQFISNAEDGAPRCFLNVNVNVSMRQMEG